MNNFILIHYLRKLWRIFKILKIKVKIFVKIFHIFTSILADKYMKKYEVLTKSFQNLFIKNHIYNKFN